MKNTVLKYGAISGGILALTMVATVGFRNQVLQSNYGELLGYSTMVIAFLMVFFGIRSYRENESNGQVSFGRAFKVGILITLIASACYVVTWEFIYFKVTPDFVDKYATAMIDKQRKAGADEAAIAATREKMEKMKVWYQNPIYNAGLTTMEVFPVGLLATIVSAAILRRRKDAELASA